MPFFKIETNQKPNGPQGILKKASEFIADMLSKPEKYVMVSIETDKQMIFSGDNKPTAFIQLKSIGLPIDKCGDFSSKICKFINDEFDIQADRVFIDFKDLQRELFGWNNATF